MFYVVILLILIGLIITYFLSRKRNVPPIQKTRKHVFGVISDTIRGEKVRSKAEKAVADYLYSKNIYYIYEKTIIIGKRKQKIKYDFFLPFENVYVEYWGLENSTSEIKKKYSRRKQEKIMIYNYYKLNLVSLYPEDLSMIDTVFPIKLINSKGMYSGIKHKLILWFRLKLFQDYQFYPKRNSQNGIDNLEFCVYCGIILPESVDKCNRCGSKIIQ
ncbi:MAG: hypothetical protein GPJ54_12585 [Candidatus Heimdallarchaeota archaeon]|nr:hypothetical protein [Candidatus Heimdallarchaeota archaeon]